MNMLWLPWNLIYLSLYEGSKRRLYYHYLERRRGEQQQLQGQGGGSSSSSSSSLAGLEKVVSLTPEGEQRERLAF